MASTIEVVVDSSCWNNLGDINSSHTLVHPIGHLFYSFLITYKFFNQVRCVDQNFKKSKGPSMYTLYLEAVSVFNNKSMDCVVGTDKGNGAAVQFTQKDYDAIQV